MIDKVLLDILACPFCKGSVSVVNGKIVCGSCGRKYPIIDGIPVMLVEEAENGSSDGTQADVKQAQHRPKYS